MKRFFLAALFLPLLWLAPAHAQTSQAVTVTTCGGQSLSAGNPSPMTMDLTGKLCDSGSGGSGGGAVVSNAGSGIATTSTNQAVVAYDYVFNGTTWDQMSSLTLGSKHAPTVAIVDASGNQITTFGGAATTSNASSGVATSSTNAPVVSYNYGFNGTTWDQIQVDASKNLKVASHAVFGPTAVGSAAANPPVLSGGTVDGTATGNVAVETVKAASTAAVATDTSKVVQLNPNSPGIVALGQTTKSLSLPTTMASDQSGSQPPANGVATTPTGYTYNHITTDATTVVKSGAGVLHTICVNTLAATSTITVDDATSATTPTIAVIGGGTAQCYTFDVAFSVGLTIVTAVAAPDITVSYR